MCILITNKLIFHSPSHNNYEQRSYNTEVEFKKFPSWVAFVSWKEEEERSTYSCFVKPTGEVVSGETHDGMYLQCIYVHNNMPGGIFFDGAFHSVKNTV